MSILVAGSGRHESVWNESRVLATVAYGLWSRFSILPLDVGGWVRGPVSLCSGVRFSVFDDLRLRILNKVIRVSVTMHEPINLFKPIIGINDTTPIDI